MGNIFRSLTWIDALGYLGAMITLAAYFMKTMIPLRTLGICANITFITYGFFAKAYPSLVLGLALLPLNATRLYQMLELTKKVKEASRGDLSMDWLKPFMAKRAVAAGEVLFRKGDLSDTMFYTVTGKYHLIETGTEIAPGHVIGEVGLMAPGNKRTLSFECVEAGELLTIGYSQIKQLYYQNPKFGFYFMQLMSKRLFDDIERAEAKLTTTSEKQSVAV
jgi:CRP/FNR family transcriptional regulator, cyclic AMP receptor protein